MRVAHSGCDCDVAIVGYGPTGATLANLLALSGVRVTVLDREHGIYPLPRAVHFDGEVMRVFQTVGIGEALAKKIRVNPGMRFVDTAGELLLDWPRPQEVGPHNWHASYRFHQPDLEALLRARLGTRDGVSVLQGAEVFDIRDMTGGVRLHYRRRGSEATEHLEASYVVGCDGANSLVRQFMDGPLEDLGFEERWLVIDMLLKRPMPELGDHSIQYCDPHRPVTYCRSPENRRRWEFTLRPDEESHEMTQPQHIWSFLERWIGPEDADIERSAVYTFRSALASRWRRGRLLLAGDAAHLTPPFMGQGMCAGIRDAANLGWKLARCIHGTSAESILDSYETERKPHARTYIDTAMRLGGLINNLDRESGIELGQRRSGRSATMQSIAPRLGAGLAAGCSDHTGALFPQPRLVTGHALDDLCGYRPLLITRLDMQRCVEGAGFDVLLARDEPDVCSCLDELATDAVLVRPDRYILGTANTPDELNALLEYRY